MDENVTTAHRHWDHTWRTKEGRAEWEQPDEWVAAMVPRLRAHGAADVLDLGCGVGRHAAFLASEGFQVDGIDRSETGIEHARQLAVERDLAVRYRVGAMDLLPYPDGSFDYVLAFNVVYHGDESALRRALAEVRRVLRPNGWYQATMLSKRNKQFGKGTEISANTFVQPEARDDKVHPHLYCDAGDVVRLHTGFELVSATDRPQVQPGSYHWHLLFERNLKSTVG
jgi:SAM-dependent methyltransferase